MRRPFRWDKKYLYWGITAFCVVAAAILFYMALNYIGAVGSAISALVKILSPFIWGLVISYLLGPLVRTFENKVFRPLASSSIEGTNAPMGTASRAACRSSSRRS